jgi:hypothetical protein
MRFKLTQAHHLRIDGIDRWVEAGTVIDADQVKGFAATPHMRALDPEGYEHLRRVCEVARREGRGRDVPGYGHLGRHPGGEFAAPFSPPDAAPSWVKEDRSW